MISSFEAYPSYTFKADLPGPALLISAGVHGDEYEPMIAAWMLVHNMRELLKRGSVTIVPVVNRTAYARGSRFGGDGLDLARVCPGNLTGSVTERDAAFISEKISETDYYIDMHTGGAAFDIFPLAGYMLHPHPAVLEKQRRMALAFGLPVVWGTESKPNGRTLSVARDASVPAIYVEHGGGNGTNEAGIAACYDGCVHVLSMLGMTGQASFPERVPDYLVEDDQPDAGYLQVKLPAPHDGIFQAKITVGSRIRAGEQIGTVKDPLQGVYSVINADISGLLLFVRVSAKVKKGESLGGIIQVGE